MYLYQMQRLHTFEMDGKMVVSGDEVKDAVVFSKQGNSYQNKRNRIICMQWCVHWTD